MLDILSSAEGIIVPSADDKISSMSMQYCWLYVILQILGELAELADPHGY